MRRESLVRQIENSENHVDVLVVGAGISGIAAAWHLHNQDYWREQEESPAINYNADEFVYDHIDAKLRAVEAAE